MHRMKLKLEYYKIRKFKFNLRLFFYTLILVQSPFGSTHPSPFLDVGGIKGEKGEPGPPGPPGSGGLGGRSTLGFGTDYKTGGVFGMMASCITALFDNLVI